MAHMPYLNPPARLNLICILWWCLSPRYTEPHARTGREGPIPPCALPAAERVHTAGQHVEARVGLVAGATDHSR